MLRLTRQLAVRPFVGASAFHTSVARSIAKGDKVPSVPLQEGAPSKTVDLAKETAHGKYLLVGVPGAYSPGCTQQHVPGYLTWAWQFKENGIKNLFVVTVNDAFVTGAWEKELTEEAPQEAKGWIKVLADPSGNFSRELDTLFDASKFFGNERSQRYAAVIEDGKIVDTFVEPDNTSVDKSSAENVTKSVK